MEIEILYEDNHIIAVNKKIGDIVQGDETGDKPLSDFVKEYIKKKYQKPGEVFLGVVHRIDRPVSGVVLFARTSKALTRLNDLFKTKEITKTYWAVVKNKPKENAGPDQNRRNMQNPAVEKKEGDQMSNINKNLPSDQQKQADGAQDGKLPANKKKKKFFNKNRKPKDGQG